MESTKSLPTRVVTLKYGIYLNVPNGLMIKKSKVFEKCLLFSGTRNKRNMITLFSSMLCKYRITCSSYKKFFLYCIASKCITIKIQAMLHVSMILFRYSISNYVKLTQWYNGISSTNWFIHFNKKEERYFKFEPTGKKREK